MSTSHLNLSSLERHFARNVTPRRKVLRILWPSHCQATSGWVVGWSVSDCISVATVIGDADMQKVIETKGTRPATTEKTNSGSSSPHSAGSTESHPEGDDYDSDTEYDGGAMHDVLRPPKILMQKVELLNQDFAKQYWQTELQILGFYDPTNTILRRVGNYGFGSPVESKRPQILFVDGRSDLVAPQQIVLYDQPRQNEMFADMFEWKKATKADTNSIASTRPLGNSSNTINTSSSSLHSSQTINNSNSGSNVASSASTGGTNQPAINSSTASINSNRSSGQRSRYGGPFANRSAASTEAHATYRASFHQINTSRSVEWMLVSPNSPLSTELTRESALRAFQCLHSHYQPVLWAISRIQVFWLTAAMVLLHMVRWALNRKIPILGRPAEYGLLGGFLDKRIVILLNFCDQAERMKTVQYTWQNDATVQRAWLRFYNTSLSMLLDSFLGLLAAYVLWTILAPIGFSHATITSHMTTLWGYEWLNDQIQWIMVGAPAGLKLNLATGHALGSVFAFYIEQWSVIVQHLAQATPYVLALITACGACFGLSMLIVLVHDIAYFVNMHIYWLYAAITRVYHVQLVLLRSLWLLFRGKKSNTLKQRIDSCNASLDQLIVGTLLFTSLIFLLPTIGLYYAFFVYAMCLVLALQAAAQLLVNTLNYSPLYAILLYVLRSRTLAGGIQLHSLNTTTRLASSTSTTSLVQLADQYAQQHRRRNSNASASGINGRRKDCTYFQLRTTFVSPSVLLADLYKTLGLVAANYQLSKLINSFLFGNTWQNKRFQPARLKSSCPNIQVSASTHEATKAK